ncbi:MAG: SGNH/GDSL hydrolase family protein [Sumerlaeia bacterium]
MLRRSLLLLLLLAASAFSPALAKRTSDTLTWTDARELTLEGMGWDDPDTPFSRLPTRAKDDVTTSVWWLSHHSAGVAVRFLSDSPEIWADWDGGGAMVHMPRTGVSGLDLYHRGADEEWKWVALGKPDTTRTTKKLSNAPTTGTLEYLLFLPLYESTDTMRIGTVPGSTITPAPPRQDPPLVFYGTSITQGGCASRPGMAHVAILGRWLDRETINLGFSGSGQMEIAIAELLGEIDASVYALEALPNMTDTLVAERVAPFVRRLRELRPDTPILLIEHCLFPTDHPRNVLYRSIYNDLRAEGIMDLHYLANTGFLEGREEATVDGIHPTDLGFFWMAEAYEAPLRSLLAIP